MSWRNSIPIHSAADLFPLLGKDDLVALGNDIKVNGLASPVAIQIDKNKPVLVDGRNRLDAMEIVGLRVRLERGTAGGYKLLAEEQLDDKWVGLALTRQIGATVMIVTGNPVEYITSANIHRRHLTLTQKKEIVAALLKENPERSDRATGGLAKVDGKTVAAVRRDMEGRAEIPHVDKRVDTTGRQQPATKAPDRPYPFNLIGPNGEKPEAIPEGWLWSEKKHILYRKPNPPRIPSKTLLEARETEAVRPDTSSTKIATPTPDKSATVVSVPGSESLSEYLATFKSELHEALCQVLVRVSKEETWPPGTISNNNRKKRRDRALDKLSSARFDLLGAIDELRALAEPAKAKPSEVEAA
jgi:hypothetical protein